MHACMHACRHRDESRFAYGIAPTAQLRIQQLFLGSAGVIERLTSESATAKQKPTIHQDSMLQLSDGALSVLEKQCSFLIPTRQLT